MWGVTQMQFGGTKELVLRGLRVVWLARLGATDFSLSSSYQQSEEVLKPPPSPLPDTFRRHETYA